MTYITLQMQTLLDRIEKLEGGAQASPSSPDTEQDGTFTGVVIKRMGVLIDTADKSSRWEMEARAAMMSATHLLKQPAAPAQCSAATEDDWRADPASDERWNAGLDFAMEHLCKVLHVNQRDVNWEAATETLDGDVMSVIGNIMRVKYGEDWGPRDIAQGSSEPIRDLLEFWMDRTRLQTFEDRERFRKAAADALAISSANRDNPQQPDDYANIPHTMHRDGE